MLIGDVIRKYRKQAGITQEEMARRLGVTTPAVNKWEKNNTQPDITLLAPIARLLGITTDTLLSYRESLSPEEIAAFVKKLDQDLETREYGEVFADVKKTATTIQQLQIGISASYNDTGLIVLKNVPIQWDVEP